MGLFKKNAISSDILGADATVAKIREPVISPHIAIIIQDIKNNATLWKFKDAESLASEEYPNNPFFIVLTDKLATRVVDGSRLVLSWSSSYNGYRGNITEPRICLQLDDSIALGTALNEAYYKAMQPVWDKQAEDRKLAEEKANVEIRRLAELLK